MLWIVLFAATLVCIGAYGLATIRKHGRHRFASLVDAIPGPLVIVRESDGCVLATSMAWRRLTGWPDEEALGRRLLGLDCWVKEQDGANTWSLIGRAEVDQEHETDLRRADGTIFRGAIAMTRVRIGRELLVLVMIRDVTQARDQEIKLRTAEDRLVGLLLSVPDYMAISTVADGRLIEVNHGFEEITGWSKSEAIGRTSIDIGILSAEQRADGFAVLQKNNGVVRNYPVDLRRRDGTICHMLMSLAVFPVNGVTQMVAIGRDISEIKQQELALRSTQERLACMFQAIPEFVSVSTLTDGRLVDVNKGFEEMTGWTRDEVIGRTSLDLGYISTEARQQGFTVLKKQGFLKDYPLDIRAKDGSIRNTLMSCAVFSAGGLSYLISVSRDVTDLRRKEQELRLSDAARAAAEADAMLAQEETIKAQRETLRVQREKISSLTQLVSNVAHEINTPIGAIKSSGSLIASDLDEETALVLQLAPVLSFAERELFVRLINCVSDKVDLLSSREERAIKKAMTEQLAAAGIANSAYKAEVLITPQAQRDWMDFLPLLNHPQSNLVFDAAHRLGAIFASTKNIVTAVERVAKIVSTLKTFAEGGTRGTMVAANIKDGVELVLDFYRNQLRQGVEVRRTYEGNPHVNCDSDALRQVWTHLVLNALQAMNYMGALTIAIRQEGDEALVAITDTGAGIPEETLPRIFEPFFSTRPKGEGSGLGLSVSKKIVEQHGGRMEVQTVVGAGSTFSVYLPLVAAHPC